MKTHQLTIAFALLLSATTVAANCELGTRYRALADQARDEYRDADALDFLRKAAAACGSYENWLALGELATEFNDTDNTEQAASAFVKAYEAAEQPAKQAKAATHYAVLLHHSGDPQRALTYVRRARDLAPQDEWIAGWYGRIKERTENLQAEDVVRGLGDIAFEPLQLRVDPTAPSSGGGAGRPEPVAQTEPDSRRIEIPLYFELNSVVLDDSTRRNVATLAQTLATEAFADRSFTFVGHADTRGDAGVNQRLSLQRAQAVLQQVETLEPTLAGRITAQGMGEAQPVSFGNSEESHRENRRLEVIAR